MAQNKQYQRKTKKLGGGLIQTVTRSSDGSVRVTQSTGNKQHRIAFSSKDGKQSITESRNQSGWIQRRKISNTRRRKTSTPKWFSTSKRKGKSNVVGWWILLFVVIIMFMR